MDTYLECTEEFVVTDSTVTVAIEMVDQMLRLFLRQVETVIDEAPSEVLNIELSVAIVVHGLKDSSNTFDAAA